MRGRVDSGRGNGKRSCVLPMRLAVILGGATVVGLLFVGAVEAWHGASASLDQPIAREVGSSLRDSAATAPSGSCPVSGPLGGLNTPETIGVLAVIAIAGIGGGIAIGRFLNPQPLPPGVYLPRSGTSGETSGEAPEPPDPAIRAVADRKAGGGNTPGQESVSAEEGTDSIREDTWTEGGKTAGDDIARETED